jgi:hypothetical protein
MIRKIRHRNSEMLYLATLSGGVATLTVSTTPAVRTYSITAAYTASTFQS